MQMPTCADFNAGVERTFSLADLEIFFPTVHPGIMSRKIQVTIEKMRFPTCLVLPCLYLKKGFFLFAAFTCYFFGFEFCVGMPHNDDPVKTGLESGT